jgi:aryl-alcohol dehydrogenase-like predicted oxidoreductase
MEVSPIGYGTAPLGYGQVEAAEARRILNGVLDIGINIIDTAHCYSESEPLIGKYLSHRREEMVLVSKWGHKVAPEDPEAYSPELVRHSLESTLKLCRTDYLDVYLMHGGTVSQMQGEDILSEFEKCRTDGLVRFIGYSGDNEEAAAAVDMDAYDCLEISMNICDQQCLDEILPSAGMKGLGVFVKRPLANTCWRDFSDYGGVFDYVKYSSGYAERLGLMGFTPESLGFDGDWLELAFRFSAFHPDVHSILTGSRSLEHLRSNLVLLDKGPLPREVYEQIRALFREHDNGSWVGLF